MRAWIDYYVMGHRNTFIRNRAQGGLWGIYVEGDQNQFLDNLLTGWNGVLGWDGVNGTRNAWLRNTIVDTENSGPERLLRHLGPRTHTTDGSAMWRARADPACILEPPRVATK